MRISGRNTAVRARRLAAGLLALAGAVWTASPLDYESFDGRRTVVHVATVAPAVIQITLWEGKILYGEQVPYEQQPGDRLEVAGVHRWIYRNGRLYGSLVGREGRLVQLMDRYVGDRADAEWASARASYAVSSPDDPAYAEPRRPAAVHRKTKPMDSGRVGPSDPWRFDSPTETVVFLRLDEPLEEGRRYTVFFHGKPLEPVSFTYEPARLRSEAVHVSHIGFHPDDPVKLAFLSCWMGDGGGLDYPDGLRFAVIDWDTGQEVYAGAVRVSKDKNDRDEDGYQVNYNRTTVYEMDFSALRREGVYVVSVEGVGRSYPFRISRDAWREAFRISARGFYHQRSGIELGPPYTVFRRPRPFHPDDGMKIYASTCPLMATGNGINYWGTDPTNFDCLVKGKTNQIVPNAWGGYMDAGDWDRRIQHLKASRYLLELAGLFPDYFARFPLNIPESGSGLPDVVSEALFNLDCYRRLQTADGGIRGGIESEEHPRWGEASWQESLEVMAYAPGIWSSHSYAAAAAKAAWWLRQGRPRNGRRRAERRGRRGRWALSRAYEQSALRAMEYAERHWGELGEPKPMVGGVIDMRNLAAAELYRLTGDERWNQVFLETTVFTDPDADLFKWPEHEQRDAAWVYVRTARPGVDETVQANCRRAILREADERVEAGRKSGFHWTKFWWQPVGIGALTRTNALSLCRAHVLTGEEKYLRAAVLACLYGAGANPMNLSFTTGLGLKYPLHVLHLDSRISHQRVPPGLTVFGPLVYDIGKDQWGQKLADPFLYPEYKEWPAVEAFWDVFWYSSMDEFTIHNPMAEVAYVRGYLAALHGEAE